jgi:exonuclease III
MTFSSTIASTWRKADELLFQTEQAGNVKIATWNSNHLTDKKAEHIAWYICATQIDIMFIQDTRLTPAMYKSISYKFKNLLGSETFVASTIRPHSNCTAGGQLVIINSALKNKIDGLWCDKTGLGLAMAVTIDTSGSKLQVLSTYWPAKPCDEDSGGLHNATVQSLNNTKDPRRPLEFVQDTIARRIINHQENQNNNFVVVGDLNAR